MFIDFDTKMTKYYCWETIPRPTPVRTSYHRLDTSGDEVVVLRWDWVCEECEDIVMDVCYDGNKWKCRSCWEIPNREESVLTW